MNFTRFLPIVALGAFAADCGSIDPTDTETDTSDPFCMDCELLINFIDTQCDDNGNGSPIDHSVPDDTISWQLTLGTWADTVEIDLYDSGDPSTNPWSESHQFPATANVYPYDCGDGTSSEFGYCDRWEYSFAEVGTIGEVSDGTTILNCSWYGTTTDGTFGGIAIKASVADNAGNDDCIILGHESSTVYSGDGCACAEEWINPLPTNPCGDHPN